MDKNQIREFVYKYDSSITRYEAYYYGYPEIADELCRLVMEGEKRATTGLLKLYELENEPLPRGRRLFRHPGQPGNSRAVSHGSAG